MAVRVGAKVFGVVTLLVAIAFGEIYIQSLEREIRARILRAHFIIFIEAILVFISRFIWNNFSTFPAKASPHSSLSLANGINHESTSLKKSKYSDINLSEMLAKSVNTNINTKWTKWKTCLIVYLLVCHSSYFTNYVFIGRNPNIFSYACYAALGLYIQIATGLAITKVVFFPVRKTMPKLTMFTRRREQQLALVYAFTLWLYGVYNGARAPTLKKVEIPVKDLPSSLVGLKLVQLSDIHLGPTVGRWHLERIVDIVNKQNPDIVALTGDLVDSSVQKLHEAVEPLVNIKAKYGKYFVSGNHEYHTGDVDNWFMHLRSLDFSVLHNDNVKLPASGLASDQICLAGVDDLAASQLGYVGHGMDLDKALGSCDQNKPVILLAHQPRAALTALNSQYRTDVVLSGHTHGGQFFPATILVYLVNPFFYGLYKHGENSHVYVSEGTQYWGIPVRIGTTLEITEIVLTRMS